MEIQMIQKDEIAKLHFLPIDVLGSQEEQANRKEKLIKGMKLGNLEKHKCKIAFHSLEGDKSVETTIWSVTDNYVCLKGNLVLLVAAIFDVIIL